MEKIIAYENLRNFAYSNDRLIKGDIKGIVLDFYGLGYTAMQNDDSGDAKEYADEGIIQVIPYCNPWCWMNRDAVALVDEIVEVLCAHYGLGKDVKIASIGGSMGGLSALVYCAYARITPIACVANCPVCDLPYHFTERPDLPRTLYSAFFGYDGTMEEAMRASSPIHLASRMPHISYTVFHCENDRAVNLEKHSLRFVEKMVETGHEIKLLRIPHRSHCDLSPSTRLKYRETVLEAFERV